MKFWKMEGLGNDFVVVAGPRSFTPPEVRAVCDRRRGVGADGLLVVSGRAGGAKMSYFNADGSIAEMCGNGLRCVARWAVDQGLVDGAEFPVETALGPRMVEVSPSGTITAELGAVVVGDVKVIDGRRFRLVSVGNPHAVTWVDDLDGVPLETVGRALQDVFADGVNVEMVRVESPDRLSLRVWERGVGETQACGTGAVAAVAAAAAEGLSGREARVSLAGGEAQVRLERGTSWISGPARFVFEGEWPGWETGRPGSLLVE